MQHAAHRERRCAAHAQAQLAAAGERSGGQDPAKAARLLAEVAAVAEEADLSGIAVVEADKEFLQATTTQV
jgi:hypothetical protein